MKIWICPGSFDPVTKGHIDIISRASVMCDKLIVAVGENKFKKSIFTIDERIDFIRRSLNGMKNVEVESFQGLLVDYAKKKNAICIVKGLRAVSDFEYEMQMAFLNKRMDEDIETVFLMTNINYSFLSSSAVKELALHGGPIEGLIPDCIIDDVRKKFLLNIAR
ncbi:MAG TPA: pantetheine-phosphate adenylyltransferase [Clostridia bacterium]|nr:MAG: Phosphopantetheine adenylyltransferase [Firmicutes bacterium ADurb.Bin146]HOD93981.1 pantetheine-phosphate adenylyltransferase [Clostridia bacterium]HQM38962.1 pantetheine-phosphate adenylyltransferase [Clostridia bacterium]